MSIYSAEFSNPHFMTSNLLTSQDTFGAILFAMDTLCDDSAYSHFLKC